MFSYKPTLIDELRYEWRSLTAAQKWLYFLYTILLVSYTLPFFRAIETRVGLRMLSRFSDTIFIVTSVLGSIAIFRKKVKARDIMFLFALLVVHHLSGIMHVGTALYVGRNASRFIWSCLPMFLVGLTIDKKTSPRLFVGISYWALLIHIIYLYVFGISARGEEDGEAMFKAYDLLPFVCFLVWNAFQRKGLWNIIIATIATFLLFSLGARGPILCLVFFIAVYLFFFIKFKYNKASKLIIGITVSIIYVFSTEISLFLSGFSSQLGLSSRVYNSIIEEKIANIEESNGRDEIWKDILNTLYDNRIFFDFNLYADRLYTGHDSDYDIDRTRSSYEVDFYNGSIYDEEEIKKEDVIEGIVQTRYGWYAHNIELELLCDFGLAGGAIAIILLFLIIWRAFRLTRGTDGIILLLVFFTASIMQLQFSGSYLRAPDFWLFMGMCIAIIRSAKKNKKRAIPLGYRLHLLKQEIKEARNR